MISTIVSLIKSTAQIVSLSFLSMGIVYAASPQGPYTAYKLRISALISVPNGAYVYFASNHQCGANRAYVDGSRSDFKTLYSTLLAAQTAGALLAADLRDTSPGGSCNGATSTIANLCVGDETGPCFTGW
jgi:hypothetical protein